MPDTISCSVCNHDLSIDNFPWKNQAKGVRQSRCKECQSKISKAHYQNNAQSYKERAKERNKRVVTENRQKLYVYLSSHPCIDCGEANILYLQFDHVRGSKTREISKMLQIATSWTTIEKEIAKCEVRCANCHRIKTGERGNSWRNHFSL